MAGKPLLKVYITKDGEKTPSLKWLTYLRKIFILIPDNLVGENHGVISVKKEAQNAFVTKCAFRKHPLFFEENDIFTCKGLCNAKYTFLLHKFKPI